jgi:hypothetical protein
MDTRLGRRWNQDPVILVGESPYLVNGGNPIYYTDPNGDFKTKFGAQWYKLWHGGRTVRENKNGEWYVIRNVKTSTGNKGNGKDVLDEVVASAEHYYGKNGKSEKENSQVGDSKRLTFIKGEQVLKPLDGFWDYTKAILFGRSFGMYDVGWNGKITGLTPASGVAPIGSFAKGIKILQYGGHTINNSTLKALQISKEQGKIGIEAMKKANQLPPNFHGNIGSDGSFWSKAGEYVDNILDYLK